MRAKNGYIANRGGGHEPGPASERKARLDQAAARKAAARLLATGADRFGLDLDDAGDREVLAPLGAELADMLGVEKP